MTTGAGPYAGTVLTYSLDYESKWWLPVPAAFPTPEGTRLEEWVDGVVATSNISPAWSESLLAPQLPELLVAQVHGLDPQRAGALWYCPYGLPAAGVVQLFIAERADDDLLTPAEEIASLTSFVAVRPLEVRASGLGPGMGYSRIVGDEEAGATVAELGYLFTPPGARVAVIARSGDAESIGLMAPELWALVDSIVLGRA